MSTPAADLTALDSPRRLAALHATGLLDSSPEEAFDRITRVAAAALGVPISNVSLIDDVRQFFKSRFALGEGPDGLRGTPLTHSYCKHVVMSNAPLVVGDARSHLVTRDNPAVADGVIAYVGVPIAAPGGEVLGSLCVVDSVPRTWNDAQLAVLVDLAAGVEAEIALRSALAEAAVRERALRTAELKFRAVAESASDAIVAADGRGLITFWSRAATTIFGWATDEMLGRPLELIMPERFRAGHAAGMRRLAETGETRVIGRVVELVGLRRDGTEFPLELALASWADGDRVAYSGVIRDLTDRRRSEAMERGYQLLFERSPLPMWVYDVETLGFLAVNDAAVAHYGFTRDEFMAMRIVDLRPAADQLAFIASLSGVDGAGPTASRARHLTRDGRVRDVDVASHALPFEGRAARLVTAQDVTERLTAEAERVRLTSILEATTDVVGLATPDGRVAYLNHAGRRLLGVLDDAPLDGLSVADLQSDDAAAALIAVAVPAAVREGSWRGETTVRARDGRTVPVSQVVLAHRAPSGELAYFSTVMRDVSAEKAAEAALAAEREFLGAVLESLAEGVVACDGSGRLTLFNRAMREFHGLPAEPMAPERWAEHYSLYRGDGVTPMSGDEVPLLRALRGEMVRDVETVIVHEGKAPHSFLSSGQRFTDASGRVLGAVVAMHDVTERVHAERRKSEFVSTVSHELRTPLTSIRGSLGLLDAGVIEPLPPKAASLVRIARANAERLVRLVNDFLDLEKMSAGQLDYAMCALDPAELVGAAVDGIAGLAGPAHVEIVTRVETCAAVPADRDRMLQVLTNLLSNAIKFSPPHSPVVLSARDMVDAAGRCVVRFSVEDFGAGIPDAELPLLFQRFRQLSQSAATRQGGTGLGLAITKAIVEQHGGRVGVRSELGRRTEFWCDLPATEAAA